MSPKFSLQNVLDVRHRKVEALEIELGKLVNNYSEAQENLKLLKQYHATLMATLENNLMGDMDLFAISRLQTDLKEADHLIAEAEKEIAALFIRIEEKRRELIAARQAEEVLDILKNKMIAEYNSEQAQKESRTQDDIYIARAFHAQAQGA